MWYDVNKTLSHNCLLNFVVGQRGVGKTYSCKRRVIKRFLKEGEQFVYLRRYDTEIQSSNIDKFFDDIVQEFPDHSLESKDRKFYIDGHVAGYALCLSKAAQIKSVPFPNVGTIIFDEFIIDQGFIRYLPNEVETFNEMYSTIARLKDVIVLFLSNAISFTNPYFNFFDLSLQQDQKVVKKGDILLELVSNEEYAERAAQTRFGKIIAGTDYGKYAINNEFLRDKNTFVEKMPGVGLALMLIKAENMTFCVYKLMDSDYWYVSDKIDPSIKRIISLDTDSHDQNSVLTSDLNSKMWYTELKQKYYRAELRFTTMKAKNVISPYLRRK